MTDVANGESQNLSSNSLPVSSQPVQSAPVDERTFKQSEVNKLIGDAKLEAVERYKRESSVASHQSTQHQSNYGTYPDQNRSMQQPQTNLSADEIRRMTAEEIQRSRNEWIQEAQRKAETQEAQRIATEFLTKLDSGKGKHEDFEKVVKEVDFGEVPMIAHLANMVENTADVIYELAKNPAKIATLQQLVSISPKLAISEMKRLSDSIKSNEQAAQYQSPNEPLSQRRPSNNGTDRGPLTVKDYKARYKV